MTTQHRLPTPGSDSGTWGDILNDFLVQAHNADGSLQSGIITDANINSAAAIVKTKLAPGVQTSLTAADNATPKPAAGVDGKVVKWNNTSGQLEDASASLNALYAPLASPAFTGSPTVNGSPIGTGTTTSSPAANSPLRGTPVTDNCFATAAPNALATSVTTAGTSRHPFTVAVDTTDLRLVYSNWYNNAGTAPNDTDQDNPNPITISAAIEIGGVKYRTSFGDGATSVTLASGGWTESNPLPIDVAAGTIIYVWTYISPAVAFFPNAVPVYTSGQGGFAAVRTDTATVTSGSATISDTAILSADFGKPVSGTGIPANSYVGTVVNATSFTLSSTSGTTTSVNATAPGASIVVGGDLTNPLVGTAACPDNANKHYIPSQITGRPLKALSGTTQTPVAILVGDSLMAGSNDITSAWAGRNVITPTLAGGGFVERALYGKVPFIHTAMSGDQATLFLGTNGHHRRFAWAASATTMLCNYGRNDTTNGRTAVQLQADLISIWTIGARRGMRVIALTITPNTTSTDQWTTLGNQAIASPAAETKRLTVNNWLRDGAPVTSASNLTAVATGTVGALRMGSAGHPLYTVFDVADLSESARDSGLWRINPDGTARTVTDATMSLGGPAFGSATAAFTSADIGSIVTVAGAGSAGATFVSTILSISSGVSTHTVAQAAKTVSGATATINVAGTVDGLHPSSKLAIVMSAAIDLTKIV